MTDRNEIAARLLAIAQNHGLMYADFDTVTEAAEALAAPAASVDVVELMVLVRDIEYRVRYLDGEAWELGIGWAKKLRALIDSAGGAKCYTCGNGKHNGACANPAWGSPKMCDQLLARAAKAEAARVDGAGVDWRAMYRFQTAMRYMDNSPNLSRERAYKLADEDVSSLTAALATGEQP